MVKLACADRLRMAVVVETRTIFRQKKPAVPPAATQVHNKVGNIVINAADGISIKKKGYTSKVLTWLR